VHYAIDIVKLLMAGASVTMVCSALLHRGISYLTTLEGDLSAWLEAHEYDSVSQFQGCMSQLIVRIRVPSNARSMFGCLLAYLSKHSRNDPPKRARKE
jgi:hypothetical protein